MLKRIEWLKDCGHFANYRWDSGLPELSRINVIFGPNGSGKTSLARSFDDLRNHADGEGFRHVSFLLSNDDVDQSTSGHDHPEFDRVYVFSDRYIADSHRFHADDPSMEAVLTIGKRSVDDELRLEELRRDEKHRQDERVNKFDAKKSAEKLLESQYGSIAQQVVGAAASAGGRWKSRGSFSAKVVRTAFEGSHSKWVQLSEAALKDKIGIINSGQSDPIPSFTAAVTVPGGIAKRLSDALNATPITTVLDTLQSHPEAASWVQEGQQLHSEVDTCLFCSGPVTTERKEEINRHFSDAVAQLQRELGAVSREISSIETNANIALANLPNRGLLFPDLRERYETASEELATDLKTLARWASDARLRAEEKARNVLLTVESEIDEPVTVDPSVVRAVCEEHDNRVQAHGALVREAAEAVELHYLKSGENLVEELSKATGVLGGELDNLDKELVSIRAEIAGLESADGDPNPTARVLTEEVTRLLGRSELKFEAVGGKYRVLRHGEPAIGLSVGERTAITLVHFLETVAKHDNGKSIVVIDDPVSSLDSNVFLGVSTHIWSEVVNKSHIEQFFLLTHNFELFRQWDIQIQGVPEKFRPKHQFYEIKARNVTRAGITKREPLLAKWPHREDARKKIRSTYHHAFIAVVEAKQRLDNDDSLENRLDAQLLFPNVIRRMLESFLAFKYPERVGNFNDSMRDAGKMLAAANYSGDADALRLRLTRYAHAYSHSESPATDDVVNPEEVRPAIAAAFEFMNALDAAHFEGLCQILSVDRAMLMAGGAEFATTSDGV
ncbi:AAA family ATPase [Arthrobacter sp. RAF14]|uniref:AAA family ATPase n=1 Tax=Arthrobacter sp. RAF14 TaxID=3233051 RepID=UPI003F8FA53A